MAEDIERTIYKLELDGSAYIQGADSLSNSTKKLSEAQAVANAKLIELQKSQSSYKKSLDETNAVLKANEKETLELTKDLNALQAAGKGASAEAQRLRSSLRDIATNTREFKIEAKELATNLTSTTNQLKLHTKEVQAADKANAGFTSGLSKTYSGLRTLANLIPGIGIGGLVGLISGPLLTALEEWYNSLNKVSDAQRLLQANQQNLNEVFAVANKEAGKQISTLKILYETATNTNVPFKERVEAVKELQKEFPDYFKNLDKEIILTGGAKTQYDELTNSIIASSRARAAKAKIDELEAQSLGKQYEIQKVVNAITDEANVAQDKVLKGALGTADVVFTRAQQLTAIGVRGKKAIDDLLNDMKSIDAQVKFLTNITGLTNIAKTIEEDFKGGGKKGGGKPALEDDFEKRKAEFLQQISALAASEFESEVTIRTKYKDKLNKALLSIDQDKSITPDENAELKRLAKKLNDAELDRALDALHQKRVNAEKHINDEIEKLQLEHSTNTVKNIKNDFEREVATIEQGSAKVIATIKKAQTDALAEIETNRQKGLLTEDQATQKSFLIQSLFGDLLTDEGERAIREKMQASFNAYERLQREMADTYGENFTKLDEAESKAIIEAANLYKSGAISFEEFEKRKTKALSDGVKARNQQRLEELKVLKLSAEAELNSLSIDDKNRAKVQKEIEGYRSQIAQLQAKDITGDITEKTSKARSKSVQEYANAIGTLTQSVIAFWQLTNDAEQKQLERSINLQERRVQAAQRIAERGNAEYLRQEEDRLNDLQIKQENAARKTLAINAAVQASQAIVAVVSAIAEGAKVGGALGAIIDVAAVLGLIASSYAIVQSLKPPTPSFFVGTEDTGPGGRADNKGGFHAVLHPHERVLTAEENKKLKGLSNKEVVEAVSKFHQVKSVPQPNYSRFKEAAEMRIDQDGKMWVAVNDQNKLLKENNELHRQTHKALKSMGVNVNMDRNGFAMSFMEVVEQMSINKKI